MDPFKSFPCLLVYSSRGALIVANPGHSTYDILRDPNFMKEMHKREDSGGSIHLRGE